MLISYMSTYEYTETKNMFIMRLDISDKNRYFK